MAQGTIEPADVADAVIEGLAAERFLILPHPEVHEYEQRRGGARRMRDRQRQHLTQRMQPFGLLGRDRADDVDEAEHEDKAGEQRRCHV